MTKGRFDCHVMNSEYQNLGELSVEKRNHLIRQFQQEIGGSIRQLRRVLGLGKMMVEQALKRLA